MIHDFIGRPTCTFIFKLDVVLRMFPKTHKCPTLGLSKTFDWNTWRRPDPPALFSEICYSTLTSDSNTDWGPLVST